MQKVERMPGFPAAKKSGKLRKATVTLLCVCLTFFAAGCGAKSSRTVSGQNIPQSFSSMAVSSEGRTSAAPSTVSSQAAQIPVQSITLNKEVLTMKTGDTLTLSAIVKPDDATDKTVRWISSDIHTVALDSRGRIKAKRAGSAIIYAKTANGLQAKCVVKAVDPAVSAAPASSGGSSAKPSGSSASAARAKSFHGSAFRGSRQVIVVTANGMNSIYATLTTYQKDGGTWNKVMSVNARLGKYGLVYDSKRIEGDLRTPAGVYSLPYAFGTAANPGTRLPYKSVGSNTYYDGEYGSPTYNDLVEGKPDNNESEYMNIGPYRYGLDINFNSEQKAGKGNAIFLHCSTNSGYTAGCVSISRDNIVRLLRWIDPAQNPRILICPVSDLSDYYR